MCDDKDILEAMDLYHNYNVEFLDFIEETKELEKEQAIKNNREEQDYDVQTGEDCPYCSAIGSVRDSYIIIGNTVQVFKHCANCDKDL